MTWIILSCFILFHLACCIPYQIFFQVCAVFLGNTSWLLFVKAVGLFFSNLVARRLRQDKEAVGRGLHWLGRSVCMMSRWPSYLGFSQCYSCNGFSIFCVYSCWWQDCSFIWDCLKSLEQLITWYCVVLCSFSLSVGLWFSPYYHLPAHLHPCIRPLVVLKTHVEIVRQAY